jgi:hypothetical protein
LYEEVGSVKKVIQKLGYPSREYFYQWLRDAKNPKPKIKAPRKRINNSPEHPLLSPSRKKGQKKHKKKLVTKIKF